MLSLNQFLNERFKNFFVNDKKGRLEYANDVWEMLQTSYKDIGGIKGNGFSSVDEMVSTIPFWKVATIDGRAVAVIMYKDKGGRKSVAAATNGKREGVKKLAKMIEEDFKRSWGEKSHKLLAFVKKHFPELVKKYRIPAEQVVKLLGKKGNQIELISGEKYKYIHNLNGNKIEKEAFGTPSKPFA